MCSTTQHSSQGQERVTENTLALVSHCQHSDVKLVLFGRGPSQKLNISDKREENGSMLGCSRLLVASYVSVVCLITYTTCKTIASTSSSLIAWTDMTWNKQWLNIFTSTYHAHKLFRHRELPYVYILNINN